MPLPAIPIALVALLRAAGGAAVSATGRVAVGAAGRAAAGAAGRAGAGTAGRAAAGMAGRAGGRMAFGQGIRGVMGMFGGEDGGGGAPAYSEMEASQQSFLERMNAGEEISDDELADAPAGHVPEQLMQRRTTAQFSRMVSASMSSGGARTVGSGPPPVVQPGGGSSGPHLFPPSGPGAATPPGGGDGGQGGAGGMLNTAGTAVGGFIGAIVRATAATVAAVQGLNLMNTGIVALNRGISEYEGNLAAAYARYDVDEFQRGVRRSETMSGPLQGLLKEQSELRDSTSEVGNEISAGFAQLLTVVTGAGNRLNRTLGITETIAEYIKDIREKIFGKLAEGETALPLQLFFADVSDGKFDGKRPDFGGPKDIFPKAP